MRTWIGGHPDTRIDSRIRVSADPPDRRMPVGAAVLCILCIFVAKLALLCVPSRDDVIAEKPELKIMVPRQKMWVERGIHHGGTETLR